MTPSPESDTLRRIVLWTRTWRPVTHLTAVILEFLLVSAGSLVVMAHVYPDMLVSARVRFTGGHDSMIPFQSAWLHAGYFLRGGVELWNRFDQLNHSFFHLATGFHGLAPIVEGWLFALIAGAFDRPGEAFQTFHATVFFTLATLFRTAGALALLSLYPVPRWARVLTLVVANTVLAAGTYNGAMTGFLYSLAPLVLYFLVVFFRCVSTTTFLWVVLVFGLAFGQMPLFSLGYFYHPMHFFIVCAVVAFGWWAFQARRSVRVRAAGPRSSVRHWLLLGLGFGALAIVLAMSLDYLGLSSTLFIEGSGLGGTAGRFSQLFKPIALITSGESAGPDLTLLPFVLDFTKNRWWFSWQFMGAAALGLSLIGLTHGRHRERWIFGAAFLLTLLEQAPRTLTSVGLPAHAIMAFTNPLAPLATGAHMSMLFMGYLLIVPIALGITALWARLQEPVAAVRLGKADAIATVTLVAGATVALTTLPGLSRIVEAEIFVALALCLLAPRFAAVRSRPALRALAMAAPVIVILADLYGYSIYLYDVPYNGDRIQSRNWEGIEASDGRKINPVVIDYQNPATFSFPRHVRTQDFPSAVNTDPDFPSSSAFYFSLSTYMGAYYNSVLLSRVLFYQPQLYEMRHTRYQDAYDYPPERARIDHRTREGKAVSPLLKSDDRALYFASVGVAATKVDVAQLLASGAARWVVSLENPAGGAVQGLPDGGVRLAEGWDEDYKRLRENFLRKNPGDEGRADEVLAQDREAIKARALAAEEAREASAIAAALTPPPGLAPVRDEQRTFSLTLTGARQRARVIRPVEALPPETFVEYSLPLPDGFPRYMATNLFSADRDSIRLRIGNRELAPAQGHLIRSDTFDVRNVETDRLVVALPAEQPVDTRMTLSVSTDGLLKDVEPNRNDATGLHVVAPTDGWLVWRTPYEDGWQATINGRAVPISIANRTSMAVPVTAGQNDVLMSYKAPGTVCCTRQLVQAHFFASPLLGMIVLGMALFGAAAGHGLPSPPMPPGAQPGPGPRGFFRRARRLDSEAPADPAS